MKTMLMAMASALLAGAALAQPADPADKGSENINDGDRALDTVENIATRPLKDMNIVQKKLDPELEAMMADPYSLKGIRYCRHYIAEVRKIDGMIGPDVDSPEALAARDKKQTPAEFAFGATEALVGSVIPFAGVVRFISGADKRDKYVAAALYAGSLRRSYLKGRARGLGCEI